MSDNKGKEFEPNFGANVTQSTSNLDVPNRRLESSGISQFSCKKQEIGQFFAPTSNLTFVNGTPIADEAMKERYYKTNKRTSELPFTQERVGPGIGQDYSNTGVGGFHQLEVQELAKPKNVDQLRSLSNPKMTYKGRTISGKRITENRGNTGKVEHHRPDKFYENSEDRYFKTNGAYLKNKAEEHFIVNNTNRQNSRFFVGGLKKDVDKPKLKQTVKKSTRNNYKYQPPLNKNNNRRGCGNVDDYSKKSYKAYPNERDVTQKRTHKTNILTTVKSLIAPIQDVIKTTKKENFVGNNRPEGNMNSNVPKKPTVYDPNQVAKTTIKETTIDNKHSGNMNGPNKLTVYDPNNVAKTTIKETTIDNNHNGNMTGPKKLTTYDPNQVAKTTIKETTIDNNHTGSMSQQFKKHKVTKYDTLPKTTIRQTLDEVDNNVNIGGPKKLQTFNKKNPPKKTVKETTVDKVREGHMSNDDKGGYLVAPADAPNTNRQFTSDYEYEGIADTSCGKGDGGGYLTANPEAPNTSKQFLSDNEYTGSANSLFKKEKNYDASYNARLNVNKEQISKGRKPTQNNAKVSISGKDINIYHKKQMSGVSQPIIGEGVKYIQTATENKPNFSQRKDTLNQNIHLERTSKDILEQLKENPFAKSITDTGPGPEFTLNGDQQPLVDENQKEKLDRQLEIEKIIEEEISKLD